MSDPRQKRIVKKLLLDFQKTISYFIPHIRCGKILSEKIVEMIDFHEGFFYTFLPTNVNLESLYKLEQGIIPPIPYGTKTYLLKSGNYFHPQQIITMDNYCSKIISKYLKKDHKRYAIVEDYILDADDPFAKEKNRGKMIPHQNDVYYLLDYKNSVDEVCTTIRFSCKGWHSLIVLFPYDGPFPSVLNDEVMNKIFINAEFVLVSSYDGESYVFWERVKDNEMRKNFLLAT